MTYRRLTPLYANKEGLPIDGQVFSLISSRQTVWAQRIKTPSIPEGFTQVGILPEGNDEYALYKGQLLVAFESVQGREVAENIVASLKEDLRKDVRFV